MKFKARSREDNLHIYVRTRVRANWWTGNWIWTGCLAGSRSLRQTDVNAVYLTTDNMREHLHFLRKTPQDGTTLSVSLPHRAGLKMWLCRECSLVAAVPIPACIGTAILRGVSTCACCDEPVWKKKPMLVVCLTFVLQFGLVQRSGQYQSSVTFCLEPFNLQHVWHST